MPDMDPRWPQLLAAGRAWRGSLIPRTSTAVANTTNLLLEAIAAFDPPCDHPRATRIFHLNGRTECGACGYQFPYNQEPNAAP